MKKPATTILIAACTLFTGASASFNAMAQSEAFALSAVSVMPFASLMVAGSAGGSTANCAVGVWRHRHGLPATKRPFNLQIKVVMLHVLKCVVLVQHPQNLQGNITPVATV